MTSSTPLAVREAGVVQAVRGGLFVGGRWREASGGGRIAVEDPSTTAVIATVADATVDDGTAALDAAVAAQAGWAATAPRERGRDPAPGLRADHRPRRGPGAADDPGDGQAARGVPRRGGLRGRVLPLVLRGGGAHHGALQRRPERADPAADDEAAGRAVPVHHAVELPAGDGHPQDRARDRGRLHDGRQAGRRRPPCRCSRWPRSWSRRGCRTAS